MGVRTTVKLYFARPTFDNEVYSCFTPAGGGILMISVTSTVSPGTPFEKFCLFVLWVLETF